MKRLLLSLCGVWLSGPLCWSCTPKTESKPEPKPAEEIKPASEPDSRPQKTASREIVHSQEALESEAWCAGFRELPALKQHFGAATFTEPQHVRSRAGHCGYYGERGALDFSLTKVAANVAVAEVFFDALTVESPAPGLSREEHKAQARRHEEALNAKLARAGDVSEDTRKELRGALFMASVGQKRYEPLSGIGDRAMWVISLAEGSVLEMETRSLLVRHGNAVFSLLPRSEGATEQEEMVLRVLPSIMTHFEATASGESDPSRE